MVGPAAAGAIASATGDAVPFLMAAGVCGGALVVIRSGTGRPGLVSAATGPPSPRSAAPPERRAS